MQPRCGRACPRTEREAGIWWEGLLVWEMFWSVLDLWENKCGFSYNIKLRHMLKKSRAFSMFGNTSVRPIIPVCSVTLKLPSQITAKRSSFSLFSHNFQVQTVNLLYFFFAVFLLFLVRITGKYSGALSDTTSSLAVFVGRTCCFHPVVIPSSWSRTEGPPLCRSWSCWTLKQTDGEERHAVS